MKNIINKVKETFKSKQKIDVNKIIEEIHETFYTEAGRLLDEAKIAHSIDSDKKDLLEKRDRLKKLGFENTKEVKEAEKEFERLRKIRNENKMKQNLIDAINYFSMKYPNYKFITEESVKKICNRYNLVYGPVTRYIGTVPDVNLKKIEEFKIREEDKVYAVKKGSGIEVMDKATYDIEYKKRGIFNSDRAAFLGDLYMDIVAPPDDFDMKNSEIKDFKLCEIPDPIVLHPVQYKGAMYYLIVTAWGPEASDALVVNEKMN